MADFVNIESGNDALNIIPTNPSSITNVNLDSELIDGIITPEEINTQPEDSIYTIDLHKTSIETPSEEPILVHQDCDVSRFYGDPYVDGAFKLSNLFSELVDEYQRSVARKNLGIADKYSLTWGAISGNVLQQTDLVNFVNENISSEINQLINELNLVLVQWANDLNILLETKASLDSPHFTGEPTTTLPTLSDYSNRIPTTEWVTEKINDSYGARFLTTFTLSKTFMYVDESNVLVTANWEFDSDIEAQWLNGVELPLNTRTYNFNNVNNSFIVILSYQVEGKVYSKSLSFEKVIPKFYGKVLDYTLNQKSRDNFAVINCNAGEYAYVYIPNQSTARIAVDNIVGGFVTIGSILISNVTYYIYKTYHSGLGQLNITIL